MEINILLLLLVLSSFLHETHGYEIIRIKDVSEFISFMESTASFSGTTVYLDSDMDFSDSPAEYLEPKSSFYGTFDGQGYAIRNLAINSTSSNTGMFMYSTGGTIRNVVMEPSCSITSYFSGNDNLHVGGIIGYYQSQNDQNIIENIVSMGTISFEGNAVGGSSFLVLGGIIGYTSLPKYGLIIKNCANYGKLIHLGTASNGVSFGGLVGEYWFSSIILHFQNCFNYGIIIYNGTSEDFSAGGIIGSAQASSFSNCVNMGRVNIMNSVQYSIKSISSYVFEDEYEYCYCDENSNMDIEKDSNILVFNSSTFILNEITSVGTYTGSSLIDALNAASDHYYIRGYSHWALNKEDSEVSFAINNRALPFKLSSKLIILPNLANEGELAFYGWFTDVSCTESLILTDISTLDTLYGNWSNNNNIYSITFETRGGIPVPEPAIAHFGSIIELPQNITRNNCEMAWWETEGGDKVPWNFTVSTENITLYIVWKCTHIRTVDDFISFSKIVYSKESYSKTTIFLDSDIDFAGKDVLSIGKEYNHYFNGIFDGQGYTINNLVLKLSSYREGLFKGSFGATFQNIVIDSSCSFTSNHMGSDSYVGSIIGYCSSGSHPCIFENIVNMGTVAFEGKITNNNCLYIGGIVGYISPGEHKAYMKNCANYGTIIHSGTVDGDVFIGGLVGECFKPTSSIVQIDNCLNYGSILTNEAKTDTLCIGGIIGNCTNISLTNCVSAGKLNFNEAYAGSISGYNCNTSITHCLWTSDADYNTGISINSTISFSNLVSLNKGIINELNQYSVDNNWNKWAINMNNSSTTFKINTGKGFSVSSQLILLPGISEAHEFSGWYSDGFLTEPFEGNEVFYDITLFSLSGEVITVEFDVNNGDNVSQMSKRVSCNGSYGVLPAAVKKGHSLDGWFTKRVGGSRIEPTSRVELGHNHTLYAHWTINNYTLIFDFANGTAIENVVQFNEFIAYPNNVDREGFLFNGWSIEIDRMPANNLTITANWTKATSYLEIVFGSKDFSKNEVEVVLREYTSEPFFIERFEVDENKEETKVIIKFNDMESAKNFVEEVTTSLPEVIKTVNFISDWAISFTMHIHSTTFFDILYSLCI